MIETAEERVSRALERGAELYDYDGVRVRFPPDHLLVQLVVRAVCPPSPAERYAREYLARHRGEGVPDAEFEEAVLRLTTHTEELGRRLKVRGLR